MGKFSKGAFGFSLFHFFFILVFMAMAVVGVIFMEYLFFGLGAAIIAIGILSFFVGHQFITGIYDKDGNEYYATNIQYKLIVLLAFVVAGAAVMELPKQFGLPHFLVGIIMAVIAVFVGVRMNHENYEWYEMGSDISEFTASLGRLVPVVYMFALGAYCMLYHVNAIIAAAFIIVAALFHLFRVICVYSNRPF